MMQFVQWLSKKLKVTPSEAVQMLNEAPEEEVKKYTDLFLAETTQETGKFKSGGKINAAVTKFQNGGNLTRRQALDAFMSNHEGVTRADARRALRSAKMSFDNNNMTGDRNQFARNVIAGRQLPSQIPSMPQSNPIADMVKSAFANETPYGMISRLHNPVSQTIDVSGFEEFNPQVDYRGSFDQAFAFARKRGDKEFGWNGNRFNTNLAGEEKGWRSPEAGYSSNYWKYYNPKFWGK